MLRRRVLLQGVLGTAAGVVWPAARRALAADDVTVTPVVDDLMLITGAGGNVLVAAKREGQALIDSGAAIHGAALLGALRELPGAGRVHTVFNTHWHLEQVGSNAAFGRAGAEIVAHEKTRVRLATDYWMPGEERYQPALPPEAHPTKSFFARGELAIGGEPVEYGHLLAAHTDGDAYVYFRAANVLAAGDAISPERDPELDWFGGGWLGGRLDALALLLAITDARTRFVPSYGPVVGRAEVQAEHDWLTAIFDRMFELVRQGDSAQDMLDAGVLDGLGRTFTDPFKFVYAAHKGLWAHHNKLSPDIV